MKVGDLLIYKQVGKQYVGLIAEIKTVGGCPSAFIKWADNAPHGYWHEHGYSCTNIGNQNHVFTVVGS